MILRGFCERDGYRRIGFGECRGTVMPARPLCRDLDLGHPELRLHLQHECGHHAEATQANRRRLEHTLTVGFSSRRVV